ncbi:MAG: ABC transporter substrate-binding protein [Rhodospirillaceae bacterium]|nr:ABC transporter substrate-binding protein [Rhodospirillaceae bacterium]MCA8931584.1 ABC transporter substrate-binding protein [Rhodospirillaceae bacterium]
MKRFNCSTALIAAAAAVLGALPAAAQEEVTVTLNWTAGGDHAPIYWAQEQGWYADAGLDLTIEEGRGSGAAVQSVGVGAVEFGIADMPTVLQGRGEGADVVAVMALYVNSPYGLYWVRGGDIDTYEDLAGHTIGNPPFDAARQMWPAIAAAIGVDPDSVEFVNIAPEAKIASLQSGVIDATTHFYNVHYIYERIFGDDLGFVALRDIGFNPYGNAFIVNGAYMAEHADAVTAFVQTTQRAYAACVADPNPCVSSLARAASQDSVDVRANWDLVVELMTDANAGTLPLGHFDPARMEETYGFVADSFDIEGYDVTDAYTNEFLDDSVVMPEPPQE